MGLGEHGTIAIVVIAVDVVLLLILIVLICRYQKVKKNDRRREADHQAENTDYQTSRGAAPGSPGTPQEHFETSPSLDDPNPPGTPDEVKNSRKESPLAEDSLRSDLSSQSSSDSKKSGSSAPDSNLAPKRHSFNPVTSTPEEPASGSSSSSKH